MSAEMLVLEGWAGGDGLDVQAWIRLKWLVSLFEISVGVDKNGGFSLIRRNNPENFFYYFFFIEKWKNYFFLYKIKLHFVLP